MKRLFILGPLFCALLCGCAARQPQEARLADLPTLARFAVEEEEKNPPLPEAVKTRLEQKAPALSAGGRMRPFQGFSVIDSARGDLNGDGRDDLAVVLEKNVAKTGRADREDDHGRAVVVLLNQPDIGWKAAHANTSLILGRDLGGIFGDPYESIAVKNGTLTIKHYGGSNFRWSFAMDFRFVGGLFRLVRMDNVDMYTGTGNGEETVCDFLRGTVERCAWSIAEPGRDELLYSGKQKSEPYLFDDTDFAEATGAGNLRFLPDLGWYQFDRFTASLPLRISASQALDAVKEAHYPHLIKVMLPLTRENMDNYAKLLFYAPPGYIYMGDGGVLTYFSLEVGDDGTGKIVRLRHSVTYIKEHQDSFDFLYYMDDADGKMKKL